MSFLLLASSLTSIEPGLIFWTLVTFVLVAIILRAKAWGPILTLVQEREKQIESSLEAAKRERQEAEKLLAEQKTAIEAARREAADLMRKNQAEVERFREELLAKARKDAEELLVQNRRQIADERAKAMAEVKAMVVDLAIDISTKLIGEKLDDAKHRDLAEQFIEQLPKGTIQQRQAV
jgi:F-type H+-transporting ATPase subunit b